jgi:hypothetical protein
VTVAARRPRQPATMRASSSPAYSTQVMSEKISRSSQDQKRPHVCFAKSAPVTMPSVSSGKPQASAR